MATTTRRTTTPIRIQSQSIARASLRAVERRGEDGTAVLEDRLAVREQNAFDGELEERGERRREIGVAGGGGKPRLRAQAHAAAPVAEQDVPRDERMVRGEPVDDLRAAGGAERIDAAGEAVARPEGVGDDTRAARNRCPRRRRSPDAGSVARDHLRGASRMPEDRAEDVADAVRALHVAVGGAAEAALVG